MDTNESCRTDIEFRFGMISGARFRIFLCECCVPAICFLIWGLHVAALGAQVPNPTNAGCTRDDLRRFTLKTYVEGFPEAEAFHFTCVQNSVKVLHEIRHDPGSRRFWENAILLDGILGHADVWEDLREFLQSDYSDETTNSASPLPADVFRAKTSVIHSLGLIVAQTQNATAKFSILHYLEEGTRPSRWEGRVQWRSHYYPEEPRRRNVELSQEAIRALGLSGNHLALEYLKRVELGLSQVLFRPDDTPSYSPTSPISDWANEHLTREDIEDLSSAASDATRIHDLVTASGLRAYLADPR